MLGLWKIFVAIPLYLLLYLFQGMVLQVRSGDRLDGFFALLILITLVSIGVLLLFKSKLGLDQPLKKIFWKWIIWVIVLNVTGVFGFIAYWLYRKINNKNAGASEHKRPERPTELKVEPQGQDAELEAPKIGPDKFETNANELMESDRRKGLGRFYDLMDLLEQWLGGKCKLSNLRSVQNVGGVEFFYQEGEHRSDTGKGLRVVRVGTSGNLRTRLRTHKGSGDGGGSHRSSVFRLWLGKSLIGKHGFSDYPDWGKGSSAERKTLDSEHPLEVKVTQVISEMPFLWLAVDDSLMRQRIKSEAIAMLSNFGKNEEIDPSSKDWLGSYSGSDEIAGSGLWNSEGTGKDYDPSFLNDLEDSINKMRQRKWS